jgi:Mor family transcriptional regulator
MKKTPRAGFTALHRGFRHKVWYDFRDGTSVAHLRLKYSLTQTVVEEIIREHMRPNVKVSEAADET